MIKTKWNWRSPTKGTKESFIAQMPLQQASNTARQIPNNPKTNYLLEAWDNLRLWTDTLDLAGSISPGQLHVHSAPNGHRSILRPTEYAAIHVKRSSSKGVEATRNVTVSSLVPNKESEMVTKESVTMKSKFGETSKHNTKHNTEHSKAQSTVKHNTKLKLLHVGQMLKPKISLYSECKDDLDVWSKKYCFKTVHTGVNKLVSNNATIGFYKSARDT